MSADLRRRSPSASPTNADVCDVADAHRLEYAVRWNVRSRRSHPAAAWVTADMHRHRLTPPPTLQSALLYVHWNGRTMLRRLTGASGATNMQGDLPTSCGGDLPPGPTLG